MPFAHNARTLPWVSWPSSVVRSIIEIAVSIAQRFASVLTERVDSAAARAWAPTWSTPGSPCKNRRSAESELVTSAGITDVLSVIHSPYPRARGCSSAKLGPMRVLMLGGGTFVGRALVDAAVAAGHEVTTFTRTTAPPAGVEAVHGDRTTAAGLRAVADREWDVVFDTWSGAPRVVRISASALEGRVGYYSYVSTASVYDDRAFGSDESHPTVDADPDADATDYPADKRGAELAILDAFGERHCLFA